MRMKKWLTGMLCGALLVPSLAWANPADITLRIDDATLGSTAEQGCIYINDAGRTMVPLRLVSESLGYDVTWQPDGAIQMTAKDGVRNVMLRVGDKRYASNGQTRQFSVAPLLKENRTYLPIRDMGELYGHVYWEKDSRTVWLSTKGERDYQVLDGRLFYADGQNLSEVRLPQGHAITKDVGVDPIMGKKRFGESVYLAIKEKTAWNEPMPLYRAEGNRLTYLTHIFPSQFLVDGDTVYYTDGVGAAGWSNEIHPERLYVAKVGGDTKAYALDFAVNVCTLGLKDGQLIATDETGHEKPIDLSRIQPENISV